MNDFFDQVIEVALRNEGPPTNDPTDPGGYTRFGLSSKTYPGLDLKALTRDEAKAIYKMDWWDRYGYGHFSNYALCLKVFDHAINMGWAKVPVKGSRAHLFLQQAANEVIQAGHGTAVQLLKVDGILGPRTFATVNALDAGLVLLRFLARVQAHYRNYGKTHPDKKEGLENRMFKCL